MQVNLFIYMHKHKPSKHKVHFLWQKWAFLNISVTDNLLHSNLTSIIFIWQ